MQMYMNHIHFTIVNLHKQSHSSLLNCVYKCEITFLLPKTSEQKTMQWFEHWDSIGKIGVLSVHGIKKEWMLIALSGSLYPEHTLLKLYIDLISPSLVSHMLDWSIGARRLINK